MLDQPKMVPKTRKKALKLKYYNMKTNDGNRNRRTDVKAFKLPYRPVNEMAKRAQPLHVGVANNTEVLKNYSETLLYINTFPHDVKQ